jgi:hypothetical protein
MKVTAPNERTAEQAWPALSTDDLHRLRFFAYLRQTGRIRAPAPTTEEFEALCMALLSESPAPRVAIYGRQNAYYGGLPLLWRAWAEARWAR